MPRKPFIYPQHYFRWRNMRNRCHNPNYPGYEHYGARGIYVCKKWRNSFREFEKWCKTTYEPGKSIDRIDNDGPYRPSNCRWATHSEQQKNSRHDTPGAIESRKKMVEARIAHNASIFGDPRTRQKKFCALCTRFRLLKFFGKNRGYRDGLTSYCRPCRSAYYRDRYAHQGR